jgi:hypothetical protein
MLRPTKHSHPDRTVINVSLLLLARLKTRRLDDYDSLRKYAKKAITGGVLACAEFSLLDGTDRLSPED